MITNYERISFYIVAHQDDWQLFMDPAISKDITDKKCKIVIVHTTAGDAGLTDSYWKARETAAIESVSFRLSIDGKITRQTTIDNINGNSIRKDYLNNCRIYFLRLPDGNKNGQGFAKGSFASLEKLRTSEIKGIISIDTLSSYKAWADLVNTLETIIHNEVDEHGIEKSNVCINVQDYDQTMSPGDHSDHYATGYLIKDSVSYSGIEIRLFTNYDLLNSRDLLKGNELFWKIGMFSIYHQSLFNINNYSTLAEKSKYTIWTMKNSKFRTKN